MSADQDMRMERIDRLLHELQYEITRGIFEHDIDPEIRYQFHMPYKDDAVFCEFRSDIVKPHQMPPLHREPRLKRVK